jgi:prepilin-type N-terminal cleavage/methylation domain-containing protein
VRGFTLLELIVVLVVVGLLAAVAIPTYQATLTRAEVESTRAGYEAIGRNAQAIRALDNVTWETALATSLSEVPGAAGPGVAAGPVTYAIVEPENFAAHGDITFDVGDAGRTMAFAGFTPAETHVCYVRVPDGGAVRGRCLPADEVDPTAGATAALDPAFFADDSGPPATTTTTTPPTPPPTAPVINSAAPGDAQVLISFDPVATATSYAATCTADGHPNGVGTAAESPVVVSGLANTVTYTCTLVASNAGGSSDPSDPVTVTPAPPAWTGGDPNWVAVGFASTNSSGRRVVTDAAGNMIVAGEIHALNNPFGALTLVNPAGASTFSNFVAKADAAGVWQWAVGIGAAGQPTTHAVRTIDLDAAGGVIVAGQAPNATLTLGSHTVAANAGFVARINGDTGAWDWAHSFGTTAQVRAAAVDPNGAIIVGLSAASFNGQTAAGTNGFDDGWVAKLNPSTRAVQWATRIGTVSTDTLWVLSVDGDGNVYAAGTAGTSTTVTAGSGAGQLSNPISSNGVWVVKVSPSGAPVWLNGSTWGDSALAAIGTSDAGAVRLVGRTSGGVTFGAGNTVTSNQGWVLRVSPTGSFEGVSTLSSSGLVVDGAVVNGNGSVAVVGSSWAHVSSTPAGVSVTPSGWDGILFRMNADGTWAGATALGGPGTQRAYGVTGTVNGYLVTGSGTDVQFGSTTATGSSYVVRLDSNGAVAN